MKQIPEDVKIFYLFLRFSSISSAGFPIRTLFPANDLVVCPTLPTLHVDLKIPWWFHSMRSYYFVRLWIVRKKYCMDHTNILCCAMESCCYSLLSAAKGRCKIYAVRHDAPISIIQFILYELWIYIFRSLLKVDGIFYCLKPNNIYLHI